RLVHVHEHAGQAAAALRLDTRVEAATHDDIGAGLLRFELDLDGASEAQPGLGPGRAVRGDPLVDADAPVPLQPDEIEFRHSPIRWAYTGPMSTRQRLFRRRRLGPRLLRPAAVAASSTPLNPPRAPPPGRPPWRRKTPPPAAPSPGRPTRGSRCAPWTPRTGRGRCRAWPRRG